VVSDVHLTGEEKVFARRLSGSVAATPIQYPAATVSNAWYPKYTRPVHSDEVAEGVENTVVLVPAGVMCVVMGHALNVLVELLCAPA
jgi:hypothetical protein